MSVEECPLSTRADGEHSWMFWGDDPYVECQFCKELRDAHSGRTVREGRSAG